MGVSLVLNNIRSAYNVGSIFRTADGAGIEKIYICGYSPTPDNPKVLKTSLSSEKSVPWEYIQDIRECIVRLQEEGTSIISVEVHKDAKHYNEYNYQENTALVLGNEKTGVEPEVLELSDDIIMIDMNGRKTSLNVAVTAGIICYTVLNHLKNK